MASEPLPSASIEPAEGPDAPPFPSNAEDRKAAEAMSKLEDRGDHDDSSARKEVDAEALGKAMKNLSVGGGASASGGTEKKKVKVDPADVTLLVDQLDLSKIKATELLKQHEGDAVKAMIAFIMAPV